MASNLNLSKSNVNRVAPVLAESNTSFFSTSPNPTSGTFSVTIVSYQAGTNYDTDVYSTSGNVVFQGTIKAQTENITLQAPNGFYFVRVNTPAGAAVRKISLQAGADQ